MANGPLRQLAVKIGFNNMGANSALKQTDQHVDKVKKNAMDMGRQFDRIGTRMNQIGSRMMMRVTLPLIGLGVASLKAASDAEEMQSKFNTVFGSMATSTQDWAETTARSIGRSRYELMGYLADSQNMLVGMGATREEGAELSKQITQLAVDLASFNNVSESGAIASLQSAMIGNHEAAKSLGAVISENTLAMAMERMQITGKFQDLDELQKMQVRYTAILMQSEDAVGDAERTSGSFANQTRALKAEIGDLGVTIGTILIPYAKDLIGWARNGIEVFSGLDESTQHTIVHMAGFATAMAPVIMIGAGLAKGIFYMTQVYGMAKVAIMGAVVAKGTLLAAIGPTALAVAGIVTVLVKLYQNWDKVTESIYKAKDALLNWNNTDSRGFSMSGSNFGMGDLRAAGMGSEARDQASDPETRTPVKGSVSNDQRIINNRSSSNNYAPTVIINVAPGPRIDNLPQQIRNEVSRELETHYRKSYAALATNTAR